MRHALAKGFLYLFLGLGISQAEEDVPKSDATGIPTQAGSPTEIPLANKTRFRCRTCFVDEEAEKPCKKNEKAPKKKECELTWDHCVGYC